jgi:hypothetical protein
MKSVSNPRRPSPLSLNRMQVAANQTTPATSQQVLRSSHVAPGDSEVAGGADMQPTTLIATSNDTSLAILLPPIVSLSPRNPVPP